MKNNTMIENLKSLSWKLKVLLIALTIVVLISLFIVGYVLISLFGAYGTLAIIIATIGYLFFYIKFQAGDVSLGIAIIWIFFILYITAAVLLVAISIPLINFFDFYTIDINNTCIDISVGVTSCVLFIIFFSLLVFEYQRKIVFNFFNKHIMPLDEKNFSCTIL